MKKYIKIQKDAFDKGFIWQSEEEALAKIQEELDELKIEVRKKSTNGIKSELGDLLFSCVGFAVFSGIDPTQSLEITHEKFKRRIRYILNSENDNTYRESRRLWNDAKTKVDDEFSPSPKRLKVAIIGCWDEKKEENLKLAKELSKKLSHLGCLIFTGGGDGIMASVNEGVSESGGFSISFSAYESVEIENNSNVSLVIPTGMGWDVRSALLMRTIDISVLIGGAIGSLQEVSMCYSLDLTLYIQTLFLSYGCDNFLRIYSRGERYPSALCG